MVKISAVGRLGSGKKATAPPSAANPARQYGGEVYDEVLAHKWENDHEERQNGKVLAYGPVADITRGGTKFAAWGWKYWREGDKGYTYWTGLETHDGHRRSARAMFDGCP